MREKTGRCDRRGDKSIQNAARKTVTLYFRAVVCVLSSHTRNHNRTHLVFPIYQPSVKFPCMFLGRAHNKCGKKLDTLDLDVTFQCIKRNLGRAITPPHIYTRYI